MLKQILWELRKILFKKTFIIMLCLAVAGSAVVCLVQFRSDSEYRLELNNLYNKYSDKSVDNIDVIFAEVSAQFPEDTEEQSTLYISAKQQAAQSFAAGLAQIKADADTAKQIETSLESCIKRGGDKYEIRLWKRQLEDIKKLPQPKIQNINRTDVNVLTGLDSTQGIAVYVLLLFNIVLIIFAASSVYPDEYAAGMDCILLTSKRGRRQALFAKTFAVIAVSVISVLLIQSVYLFIYSLHRSVDFSAPISFSGLNAIAGEKVSGTFGEVTLKGSQLAFFTSLSTGEVYFTMLALYAAGCAVLGLIVMLFSAISKSSVAAIAAGGAVMGYPFIAQKIAAPDSAAAAIYKYSVYGIMSPASKDMWISDYVNLFGYPVRQYMVLAVLALVLLVAVWCAAPAIFIKICTHKRFLRRRHNNAD